MTNILWKKLLPLTATAVVAFACRATTMTATDCGSSTYANTPVCGPPSPPGGADERGQPEQNVTTSHAEAAPGCHKPKGSNVHEYLGECAIRDLFANATPGKLSPTKRLRVWSHNRHDVFIGIDAASGWSESHVAAVWAALDKLETTFPVLYSTVFVKTREGDARYLPRATGNSPWQNTNRLNAFVVVSDDFPEPDKLATATNFYSLEKVADAKYANIPFVAVVPSVVAGKVGGIGPQPIYPKLSSAEASAKYLEDGLADSLLHERIHAFVAQFYAHDKLFGALRPGIPQPKCEYELEEMLIKKFLMDRYRNKQSAFSPEFFKYWERDLQLLSEKVVASACYTRLRDEGLLQGELIALDAD